MFTKLKSQFSIYKDKWNEALLTQKGVLKFYYKAKEILKN